MVLVDRVLTYDQVLENTETLPWIQPIREIENIGKSAGKKSERGSGLVVPGIVIAVVTLTVYCG